MAIFVSRARLLNRFSAEKSKLGRQKHSNQGSFDGVQRAFWRPSRWLRGRYSPLSWKQNIGPLSWAHRIQQQSLFNHVDKKRFSARAWVGKIPAFSKALYQRKELRRFSRGPWTPLKWTPVPVILGMFYLIYCQFILTRDEHDQDHDKLDDNHTDQSDKPARKRRHLPWHIPTVFLPLRALSRSWGWLNDLYLPYWIRKPILSWYIWTFGVNLDEAAIQDLRWYKNLGEFFRRHLKPGARPLALQSSVICPSDGTVLHVGRVEDDCIEQVKGMTYSLAAFMGPKNWFEDSFDEERIVEDDTMPEADNTYRRSLSLRKDGTDLFHCVIYLAPGDYHRFHSPADWKIRFRRHFPGHLFSVSPSVTKRIEGLFNFNERVVYYGDWLHGFFSMAAVGATNVGTIKVYFDERLKTNNKRYKRGVYQDCNFTQHKPKANLSGIEMGKGDEFGEFNLGSTIVLLFEAPKNFRFNVDVGQKVLYGTSLGYVADRDSITSDEFSE